MHVGSGDMVARASSASQDERPAKRQKTRAIESSPDSTQPPEQLSLPAKRPAKGTTAGPAPGATRGTGKGSAKGAAQEDGAVKRSAKDSAEGTAQGMTKVSAKAPTAAAATPRPKPASADAKTSRPPSATQAASARPAHDTPTTRVPGDASGSSSVTPGSRKRRMPSALAALPTDSRELVQVKRRVTDGGETKFDTLVSKYMTQFKGQVDSGSKRWFDI